MPTYSPDPLTPDQFRCDRCGHRLVSVALAEPGNLGLFGRSGRQVLRREATRRNGSTRYADGTVDNCPADETS